MDFRFLVRGNTPPPSDIIIVTYDETSFQEMEGWPWPRTYHAEAIQKLSSWGAKVIAFDQLFFDPSKLLPLDQDEKLVEAMTKTGNVVIASKFDEVVQLMPDPKNPKQFTHLRMMQYLEPLAMFSRAAPVGYLNMIKDTDGYVRRIPMVQKAGDQIVPAFSLMIYLKACGLTMDDIQLARNKMLFIPGLPAKGQVVPLGKTNSMRIFYYGVPGVFPRIPFYQILKDQVDPQVFKDKIVIIGPTALEFHDSFYTPFYGASRTEMPGVEIHANAVATLCTGNFLRKAAPAILWISLLLYGVLIAFLSTFTHPLRLGLWAILLTVLQLTLCLYFFLTQKVVYPTSAGIVQIWATAVVTIMYRTFVGERSERMLKNTFKRYVSKDVVDEILKKKQGVKLAGDKKKVTVLFADIRGFTTMSEKMDPEVLIRQLNEYFELMIQVIFRHGGTLDKFIGDAIMAVWGSPLPRERDALQAVSAAWEMQQALKRLNEKRVASGRPPLNIGIGINTGEAVVGNLGSLDRMEFTVIGDTVNTACRIEGKTLAGQILLNEPTYQEVKECVEARPVAPVMVKGKELPLQLYEVMGIKDGTVRAGAK